MTTRPDQVEACLDPETLAAFIDGRLSNEDRTRALQHIARCPDCYEVVRDVVSTWPEPAHDEPLHPAGRVLPWRRFVWIGGGLAAAAALALALWLPGFMAGRRQPSPLAVLVDAVGTTRTVDGRLTGGFAWGPPDTLRSGASSTRLAPRIEDAAAALEEAVQNNRSAATLAAFGTSRLVLGEDDRAVAALEEATALVPGEAAYWSDLALARLQQSAQPGNDATRVAALDAVEEALAINPSLPEALFNKGLILERLDWREQARRAWAAYLAVPDDPEWQAEARQRLERLGAAEAPQSRGPDVEPLRQQLWGPLLRAWVDAGADAQRSRQALSALEAKAKEIAVVVDDRMVADFIDGLSRVTRDPALTASAVRGFGAYLDLQSALTGQQPEAARAALRTTLPALSAIDSPLHLTARFNEASLFFGAENNASTYGRFEAIRREADAAGYDWLTGRCEWMLGVTEGLMGNYRASLSHYQAAIDAFERVADAPTRAAVQMLLATTYDRMGDPWRGWKLRLESLQHAPRANALLSAALSASDRGWPRAGLVFADASFESATAAGAAPNIADALRTRATLLGRLAEPARVSALIADARSLVVDRSEARWDRVRAEISLAETLSAGPDHAARGVAAATEAIDYFSKAGATLRLPELLAARAMHHRRMATGAAALADVERGLALLAERRASLPGGRDQVTFEAIERGLVAQLVALAADRGGATDAVLARVDASRGRDLPSEPLPASTAALRARMPAGTTLAAFVVAEDESFVWVLTRERDAFHRIPAGRQDITASVRRLLAAPDDPVASAWLAATLTEPITSHAPDSSRWVIVPDAVLGMLPFALLPDARGARVVEHRTVVVAPSVASWLSSLDRAPAASRRLVAVGNPTLEAAEHPGLDDLPEAEREIDAVAALYDGAATVLMGAAADRRAVVDALPRGSVIHIAAHAVSNAWMSDASYVALAGPAPSRLTATDVRALDLGPAEVVVLAACDTAAGGRPTLDNPLSLSRAFLAAGARAVVGSLWRVNDRATRVLSTRFHEEFVRTGDAALSLQRAQLALATSEDRSLNAPRQWGAFVVLGG